jgi:hypothetical protein
MPSKTRKQAKAMRAACHDPKTRKKMGISKEEACEFARADKKKRGKKKKEKK